MIDHYLSKWIREKVPGFRPVRRLLWHAQHPAHMPFIRRLFGTPDEIYHNHGETDEQEPLKKT
jgi:hypothetical protein